MIKTTLSETNCKSKTKVLQLSFDDDKLALYTNIGQTGFEFVTRTVEL